MDKLVMAPEAVLEDIRNDIFYFMTRYSGENDTRSYQLLGAIKERITEELKSYKHPVCNCERWCDLPNGHVGQCAVTFSRDLHQQPETVHNCPWCGTERCLGQSTKT